MRFRSLCERFVGSVLVVTVLVSVHVVAHAQSERGRICVAPNPTTTPERFSPGLDYDPATLTVRIDKRPPVKWPHQESVNIDGLDRSERHLVVLTSRGKPLQSFWFRFAQFKSERLCLLFDGYQGPQLRDAAPNVCTCK